MKYVVMIHEWIKEHATQANITTALAVLTVILTAGVFEFTEQELKWIYLVVGLLGAFGYNVDTFTSKIPKKKKKEDPNDE